MSDVSGVLSRYKLHIIHLEIQDLGEYMYIYVDLMLFLNIMRKRPPFPHAFYRQKTGNSEKYTDK